MVCTDFGAEIFDKGLNNLGSSDVGLAGHCSPLDYFVIIAENLAMCQVSGQVLDCHIWWHQASPLVQFSLLHAGTKHQLFFYDTLHQ
jgi:hypothetical protein